MPQINANHDFSFPPHGNSFSKFAEAKNEHSGYRHHLPSGARQTRKEDNNVITHRGCIKSPFKINNGWFLVKECRGCFTPLLTFRQQCQQKKKKSKQNSNMAVHFVPPFFDMLEHSLVKGNTIKEIKCECSVTSSTSWPVIGYEKVQVSTGVFPCILNIRGMYLCIYEFPVCSSWNPDIDLL